MVKLMPRRLGKFCVDLGLIVDAEADQAAREALRLIMNEVIVVKAEVVWERDAVEYVAISECFKPCAAGLETPFYGWRIRWALLDRGLEATAHEGFEIFTREMVTP
jgi:hypothetical protein